MFNLVSSLHQLTHWQRDRRGTDEIGISPYTYTITSIFNSRVLRSNVRGLCSSIVEMKQLFQFEMIKEGREIARIIRKRFDKYIQEELNIHQKQNIFNTLYDHIFLSLIHQYVLALILSTWCKLLSIYHHETIIRSQL